MPTEHDKNSEAPSYDWVVHTYSVPAGELSRYSVEGDPHTEMDIATYVEGQARDETIQHVEKIKREIVLGETRLIATCPWGNPLAN